MTDNVKDIEEIEKTEVEEISDEELDGIAGGQVLTAEAVREHHRLIDAHKENARFIDTEF